MRRKIWKGKKSEKDTLERNRAEKMKSILQAAV